MSEDEAPLTLTLKRKIKKVDIEKEDGEIIHCTIREMVGAQRDAWLNRTGSRMKTGPDGRPTGMRDFTGIQAGLIALCLYDNAGANIPETMIQAWPASTQTELFKVCQRINGMDEESEKEEKND